MFLSEAMRDRKTDRERRWERVRSTPNGTMMAGDGMVGSKEPGGQGERS